MAELDPQPLEQVEPVEPVEGATVVETTPPARPRKVYAGMWGPAEIIVLAAGALSLVAVIVFYILGVVPSNREVTRNKAEAERLDAELISSQSKYGDIKDTSQQVNKILTSVDDFDARLTSQSNGLAALYQRLNGLIRAYGLVNTSGPEYQPLAASDMTKPGQETSDEEKGRSKFRSLYPGVYVATTVEGSYQNLRRFIREIETGGEFVVISSVELVPSDTDSTQKPQDGPAAASVSQPATTVPGIKVPNKLVQPAPQPQAQQPQSPSAKGKMHGEIIALHIEMAAYFRRPNFAPMVQQYQQ